jgi:hypothetical protein
MCVKCNLLLQTLLIVEKQNVEEVTEIFAETILRGIYCVLNKIFIIYMNIYRRHITHICILVEEGRNCTFVFINHVFISVLCD